MEAIKNQLVIEIINNGSTFKRVLTFDDAKELDKNKVFGTAMQDLFKFINLQANGYIGKVFKLTEIFDVRIACNGITFDTTTIQDTQLKTKLKLNNSASRKRKFARTLWNVLDAITTTEIVGRVEQDEILTKAIEAK